MRCRALEVPGGSTYAVKVPASARRNYWLEWRQPVGFDASLGTGATDGALVHLGYPNDYDCDTCLLDMTPATTAFTDGALAVGTDVHRFDDQHVDLRCSRRPPPRSPCRSRARCAGPSSTFPRRTSAYAAIEALAWNGVTTGCATNPARFCPDAHGDACRDGGVHRAGETRQRVHVHADRHALCRRAGDALGGRLHRAAPHRRHHAAVARSNPLRYCPDATVTRAAMAPMLMRARWGSTFNPGTPSGTVFADVPRTHPFAAWIERALPVRHQPRLHGVAAQLLSGRDGDARADGAVPAAHVQSRFAAELIWKVHRRKGAAHDAAFLGTSAYVPASLGHGIIGGPLIPIVTTVRQPQPYHPPCRRSLEFLRRTRRTAASRPHRLCRHATQVARSSDARSRAFPSGLAALISSSGATITARTTLRRRSPCK